MKEIRVIHVEGITCPITKTVRLLADCKPCDFYEGTTIKPSKVKVPVPLQDKILLCKKR